MTKKTVSKKEEITEKEEEAKKVQDSKKFEQSVWTIKINSQLLFKKAVDGRTILLGMTQKESQGVKEVMEKTIDELSEILKDRTTQHEAPPEKEQVTRFDAAKDVAESNILGDNEEEDNAKTDPDSKSDTVDEFKVGGNAESDNEKMDSI